MPTVPRNVGEVLDKMLAIPELPQHTIKDDLNRIISSLPYTAPEAMHVIWGRIASVVNSATGHRRPEDLRGWEIELVELLTDRKISDFFAINNINTP